MRGGLFVLAVAGAMLLPPSGLRASEGDDILAAARAIYAQYEAASDEGEQLEPAWAVPVFSRATAVLIAEWEAGLDDEEVEDLNGFDWFCQWQDFDPESFRVELEPLQAPTAGTVTVKATVDLGWGGPAEASELRMVKEENRWLLDDIVSGSFPEGLKADLRKAIEEHRRLGR